jgi:pyrimidine deaminase RibD-like protein
LNAEKEDNPRVGSIIVLESRIIDEGTSSLISPIYNTRGHAEMNAMDKVDMALWLERPT